MKAETETEVAPAGRGHVIKFGDLLVEVVKKYFYCRHCDSYNPRCASLHRSAMYFVLKCTSVNPYHRHKSPTVLALVGEGEDEGEPVVFPRAYTSSGGWNSPILRKPSDLLLREEEVEGLGEYWLSPLTLSQYEEEALMRILLTEKVKQPETANNTLPAPQGVPLLCALLEQGVISLDDRLGALSVFKPLLAVYASWGTVDLPLGAEIKLHPMSWEAEFRWGDISFRLPKFGRWKYKAFTDTYTLHNKYNNTYSPVAHVADLLLPHGGRLWWAEAYGRKIVYYRPRPYAPLRAWEQYGEIVHLPARIALPEDGKGVETGEVVDLFISHRLGDVVFVPVNIEQEFREYLQPAAATAFQKIKVISGTIHLSEQPIRARAPENSKLVLYHPEHGLLELPPGEYVVYSPRYLHDTHHD